MQRTIGTEQGRIEPLLTAQEVAAALNVSSFTVRRLAKRGTLPAIRLTPHGPLRFRPEDLGRVITEAAAGPASRRATVEPADGQAAPVAGDAAGAASHITEEEAVR